MSPVATHNLAPDSSAFTRPLLSAWTAQGLSFNDPVRIHRTLLTPTARLASAGDALIYIGLGIISIASAVAGIIPQPSTSVDSRRRWLINMPWHLQDPNVIARTTPQPLDLRAGATIRTGDTLVLVTRNHSSSGADIQAQYGMRILLSVTRR